MAELRKVLHAVVDWVLDEIQHRLQFPFTSHSEQLEAIAALEESLWNLRVKVEAQSQKDLKTKAAVLLQMSELESAIEEIPLT